MKSSTYTEEQVRQQIFSAELLPHSAAIYSFAYRLTGGNAAKAKDLVQETYEKAWRFINRYVPGTNARAWLFRICHHAFINEWRKVKNQPASVALDAAGRVQTDDRADYAQMGDEVMKAINSLPNQQRIVLLLDLEDFSYEDIAVVLNVKIGTVRSRLHRARKTLSVGLQLYARNLGYGVADNAVLNTPTDDQ